MNVLPALVVWLAPILLGSGLWAAAAGWPRRGGALATVLGGGWIVGVLSCGLLMRALAASDLSAGLARVGVTAALIGVAGWAVAAWSRERTSTPRVRLLPRRHDQVVALLVLLAIAWRAWAFATDIALHPTLPWDAWAVWEAKAKTWVLAGHASPYVSFGRWLLHPQFDARTAAAWNYPELLPWSLTWFAADTGWLEPWINMAWLGLWLGLLVAQYGHWRVLGVSPTHALAGVYLLGSLPLLDAHVALGGYSDLWVAALMSLGSHAWLRWRTMGEQRQLLVLAGIAVLLPMLKLEGAVWSIVLGVATVFGALPRRLRSKRFLVGAVAAAIIIALCVSLKVPWVAVARHYVRGSIDVDGGRIVQSLFALANALWGQWNWNLLWFALPAALLWKRAKWTRSTTVQRLFALVVVPLLLIVGLFVLTSAARYAQSYSAVNRLLLQLVPTSVSLLVLVLWLPADQPDERNAPDEPAAA
jgi:hypothetical protein